MQKIPKPAKKISHDQDSPRSQQSGSSQQSTSQTKPSGQGAGSQTNQSGRPNPNQASSQGGSGDGGLSQRLSPKSKLSIRDTLAENNGNITAKQIKELVPNAKPEKVQEYLDALSASAMRHALKGVGDIARGVLPKTS